MLRTKVLRLVVWVFALSCPCEAAIRNVDCAGDITTALRSAIASSVDGDIVNVGAGSCSSGSVSWTNKNIVIQGQGIDRTTVNLASGGFTVNISNTSKANWRITGMTIQGTTATKSLIFINSENCTSASSGWRVDHMKFDYSGLVGGSSDPIETWGVTYGLFDHNYFHFANPTWIRSMFFQTGRGEQTWGSVSVDRVGGWYNLSLPSQYGTSNAIFFEDNTFVFTATPGAYAFFDTDYGGARFVIRYNTFAGGYIYAHWTRNNGVSGVQWEVYNNKFIASSTWGLGDVQYPVRFESGTGVFFNNTLAGGWTSAEFKVDDRRACGQTSSDWGQFGACDGSKPWDGNAGDPNAPGWPCVGQIGRGFGKTYAQITSGDKLPSLPAYAWNNGTQDACYNSAAGDGPCVDTVHIVNTWGTCTAYISPSAHTNGEVEFVNSGSTPMPGYKAYTYPHPLQTRNMPLPPSGLAVAVK